MRWFKRLMLALIVLALGVAAAEGVARLWPQREAPARGKKWFRTHSSWGNCYASDPTGYYPLNIRASAAQRERLSLFILTGRDPSGTRRITVPELVRRAPHCLIYNDARTDGFFPKRRQTLAMVGDSFTYGEGLRPEHTLGYLLAQRFAAFNVLNRGMSGVDIGVVVETVGNLVGPPNYVKKIIYFYNPNDAFGAAEVGNQWVNQMGGEPLDEPSDATDDTGLLARLSSVSALAAALVAVRQRHQRATRILSEVTRAYDDPAYAEHRDRTVKALATIKREADDAGADLLLVIYPFLYKDSWGRYPLSGAHRWVRDQCQRLNIRFLDGLDAFAGTYRMSRLQVNPSDAHPGPEANRKMVAYVAENAADFFR